MSERELTKDEKITAILDMTGFDEIHHEHHRELLELLSDHIIDAHYVHCLIMKDLAD